MLLTASLGFLRLDSPRHPARQRRANRPASRRWRVEQLEDRCLLDGNGSNLLVSDLGRDRVPRYDAATGAFVGTFIPKHSGGLNQPWGILVGPHDGNVYVSTGWHSGPGQRKAVLRYDGASGAFIDEFAKGGDLVEPFAIIFGPDGNLYVATGTGGFGGRIARYDGRTGAFLGDFVPRASGGLTGPRAMVFGPNGSGTGLDLYVSSAHTDSVLRYDGRTGDFLGAFVAAGSGGLDEPVGLTFGPDGNLYVASSSFGSDGPRGVLRFQGPSGTSPGTFIDEFVSSGAGGLATPLGILFGPDGNGDGQFDFYVANGDFPGTDVNGKNSTVKRYDGVKGTFIDTFVRARSGGLDDAMLMTFTKTDPVTLAYTTGVDRLVAASTATAPAAETLRPAQVQPLVAEAIDRWRSSGAETFRLSTIDIRIADLDGATLGLVSGHDIWLDDNAAGWGWYIDARPGNDTEFTTPGNHGEQHRIDLLSVLEHEIGHLLGREHEADGLMADTLDTGIRTMPAMENVLTDSAVVDSILALDGTARHHRHRDDVLESLSALIGRSSRFGLGRGNTSRR